MASGDVNTGGSSTTPNSPLVGKTSNLLLRGLRRAYKDGVDVYGKPLYTSPSDTTQQAWGQGSDFANQLHNAGGFGAGQQQAMDSLGGVFSGYDSAADSANSRLGSVFSGYDGAADAANSRLGGVSRGYGRLGDNNGLTGRQASAMTGTAGLGDDYAGLGTAYDPRSAAYKRLRQGVADDTLKNLGSQFTSSGRFGGGSYVGTASEGLGDALAGLDYGNMQNNINNQYRSLDSQRGIFGDVFGMGQQGVGNQFGALAGQAGTANSIFGNRMGALAGQAGTANSQFANRAGALAGQGATAGAQFGMGQTALGNQQGAIGLLGQVGASRDADSLARRMADADLFDKTKNRDWNTLGRASSLLGINQSASGSTTSNSVPWWAALLGGAATGASIFG
jgi:hypothetical protein